MTRRLDAWGWGLLTVEQRGQTIGHHLAGEIYEFRDGRLLAVVAIHLDRELVRLHGAADTDRVWTFHPNVVNLEGEL